MLDFVPQHPLILDSSKFAKFLRTAPTGSSPWPGGCTNEILKVCLEDTETLELLTSAAGDFARATVPRKMSECFMLASMTALQKRDGGVRGLATGTSFRRLVAKTLARQFAQEVEAVCAPFQFALSTRAGTDCVGHAVRAATEANPQATVLSIDAVGAYDHVHRSAMMAKLLEIPVCRVYFHSSGARTVTLRATNGSTQMECSTTFTSTKAGSREIPSCLCSSVQRSTMPWRK